MPTYKKALTTLAFFTFGVLSMTGQASVVKVYKSTGPHGEVRYSQSQPAHNVKYEVLEFRSDGRTNTTGTHVDPVTNAAEDPQQSQIAALNQQIKEMEQRENAQRCQSLRNNLANLNIGGRLYETDASGNRVFLSEQEINSRRERAQKMIAEYCKGV